MHPSLVSEFDKICTQFEEKSAVNLDPVPNSERMLDTACLHVSVTV